MLERFGDTHFINTPKYNSQDFFTATSSYKYDASMLEVY